MIQGRQTHPRITSAIAKLGLTKRQSQIVEGLTYGLKHDTLADELNISRSTLRSHFRHIFTSLKVANRVELLSQVLREVLAGVEIDEQRHIPASPQPRQASRTVDSTLQPL